MHGVDYFVELLSRLVRQLTISFRTFLGMTFHVIGPMWEGRTRQECQGPHLLKCTGNLSTTSWKMKLMGRRERQDDKREDGQQREESGEVEENQTLNMSAWRWLMECDVRTPNLRLEPRMCVSLYEKMWRVRCAVHTPVGCSRLLSAVNGLTTTKKILQSVTSEQLCEETAQRVSPFYMLLFHELRCAWLLIKFSWAPSGIVPLPPRCAGWRRRRMPFLVLPRGNRCESLFSRLSVKTVQLGQRFVEVWTISHRSNFSRCIERDPPILFVSKVLVFRHSIGEIFLRVLFHLDADFFSSINAELRFTKC